MKREFDIAIVGAGPAGTAACLALADSGLSIALIDKANFPRDKICGDALSPDVVNQLKKLPFASHESFENLSEKIETRAIRFVAPNYSISDFPLPDESLQGYVSPRMDFDSFMYEQALKNRNVTDLTGNSISNIGRQDDGIEIVLKDNQVIRAALVLGADGANSVVKRQFQNEPIDRRNHAVAVRQYFENVYGFSNENAIELHFYNEVLPGYFWVFPLPGNRANVGLGMPSDKVSSKRLDLKSLFQELIKNHPNISERFAESVPIGQVQGFGLPLGSKKRKLSGDRFMLLGDAASLINPLTGEGIANAIRSGRLAAKTAIAAFEDERFDESYLKIYDSEIYRSMWPELRLNLYLRKLMINPAIGNFLIGTAVKNKRIQKILLSSF